MAPVLLLLAAIIAALLPPLLCSSTTQSTLTTDVSSSSQNSRSAEINVKVKDGEGEEHMEISESELLVGNISKQLGSGAGLASTHGFDVEDKFGVNGE